MVKLRTAKIWLWLAIPATAFGMLTNLLFETAIWRDALLFFQIIYTTWLFVEYRNAKLAGRDHI